MNAGEGRGSVIGSLACCDFGLAREKRVVKVWTAGDEYKSVRRKIAVVSSWGEEEKVLVT